MIKAVAAHPVGSIWSVLGIENGLVVVLAGPFATTRGAPEYLVAPVYTGAEEGFVWTYEDVMLEPGETGQDGRRYAGIWNARPALESDLLFPLGQLDEGATVAVRDAYWASLNERPLGKHPRLGRRIRSASDPAATFQARELQKWQQISGRVFAPSPSYDVSTRFAFGDVCSLTVEDVRVLGDRISESEHLLGPTHVNTVHGTMVSFVAQLLCTPPAPARDDVQASLFSRPRGRSSGENRAAPDVAANSNLAMAA